MWIWAIFNIGDVKKSKVLFVVSTQSCRSLDCAALTTQITDMPGWLRFCAIEKDTEWIQ